MSSTRLKFNKFLEKEERKVGGQREVGRIIGLFRIWVVKKLLCCPGTEQYAGEKISLN